MSSISLAYLRPCLGWLFDKYSTGSLPNLRSILGNQMSWSSG